MKVLKADMQKSRPQKRFSAMHRGTTGSSMAKCYKVKQYLNKLKN